MGACAAQAQRVSGISGSLRGCGPGVSRQARGCSFRRGRESGRAERRAFRVRKREAAVGSLGGMEALLTPMAVGTYATALSGGATLGWVSSERLRINGEVTGISGIFRQTLMGSVPHAVFTLGLTLGSVGCAAWLLPTSIVAIPAAVSWARVLTAGALVGCGTRIGGGCTSGHGVCGLGRRSLRSLAAVCTFMTTGAMMATLTQTATAGYVAEASSLAVLATAPPLPEGKALGLAVLALAVPTFLALEVAALKVARGYMEQFKAAVNFLGGAFFAVGLGVSGMTVPARVATFLDLSRGLAGWNPALMFVMGGAVLITLPGFAPSLKKATGKSKALMKFPSFSDKWNLPSKKDVDIELVVGSAIFGAGWGLGGMCPGPAIYAATGLDPKAIAFVAVMAAATLTTDWAMRSLEERKNG